MVLIISTSIAIVVSFLCSLAEALLLSLNPMTLHRLQTENPRAAESWKRLKTNVARPITAILVLNTIAHTGGATVAGGAFANLYGEENIWIFSIAFTVVILFGTEILPKIIGVTFRDQIAPVAGPLLEGITILLYPAIRFSEILFGRMAGNRDSEQITTADLITLAALARSGKAINLEQENIIVNTIRLSHTNVEHAMIPPEKIRFIRQSDSPDAVLELARKTGHSRYPISQSNSLDDVFGFVTIKHAIPAARADIAAMIRTAAPLHSVHPNDTLMSALHTMIESKEHMLRVTDDFGKCVGLITLEDITSELLSAEIERFR